LLHICYEQTDPIDFGLYATPSLKLAWLAQ